MITPVTHLDNLIEISASSGSSKVFFLASGSRKKDQKVSFLMCSFEDDTIEVLSSIHINKAFQSISKMIRHQDYFVASAMNSFFFLQADPNTQSIEILANTDLNLPPSLMESNKMITDFCVTPQAILFLFDQSHVFIKDFRDLRLSVHASQPA